jgi:hypothetical protein
MKSRSGHAPAGRIGPSGRTALQLLACCPRAPTDVVGVLLGLGHLDSASQLLARLRKGGLAQSETVRPGPLLGSRSVRLWTLTPAGHATLAMRGLAPSLEGRGRLPFGQPACWRDPARQHDVPLLIVTYRLLAEFVAGTGQPMRVAAWEHPWIRSVRDARSGRTRHVRLPAAAVLVDENAAGEPPLRLLLLPDVGTVPVACHRPVLRGLIEVRHAADSDDEEEDEPLLVVAVADPSGSGARTEAWRSVLGQVARRTGERPLRTRLLTGASKWTTSQRVDRQLAVQGEQLFALVARHPMLTRQQLAALLNTSAARISHLIEQLLKQGWVRAITPDDVPNGAVGLRLHQLRRLALVELTLAGRRESARRLLVPGVLAARHHGLGGRAPTRRRLLRHLAHTLGANAFFVTLACAHGT